MQTISPKTLLIAGSVFTTCLILSGCAIRDNAALPSNYIITSGSMVANVKIERNAPTNEDKQVTSAVRNHFGLYRVQMGNGTTNLFDVATDPSKITITVRRIPGVGLYGSNYFAGFVQANASYAGALISTDDQYKFQREVSLEKDDPQYELTFLVTPDFLLHYQKSLDKENREVGFYLFQRYLFAPKKVTEYELKQAEFLGGASRAGFGFGIGIGSNISASQDLSQLLVLRKYHNKDLVNNLLRNPTEMFVKTDDTDKPSKGTNIHPEELRIPDGKIMYKLSTPYRNHLEAEGVVFHCQ